MNNLLAKLSITETEELLEVFVERIKADDEKAKMYYTISSIFT